MKTLIFLIFLIVSCKNPTGTEEFEPYRIGNWIVTSDDSAEYVGVIGKQIVSADTVFISSPDNRYLSIVKDTTFAGYGYFNLIFVDSTLNRDSFEHSMHPRISWGNTDWELPNFSAQGYHSFIGDYMKITQGVLYLQCAGGYIVPQYLQLTLYQEPHDSLIPFTIYRIDVDGIRGVLKNVICL